MPKAFLCPSCFGDSLLKRRIVEIRPNHPDERCSFHPRLKGVPASAVADIVDVGFRACYELGDYGFEEQEGSPLIDVLIDITDADDQRPVEALMYALIDSDPYWPPDGEMPFYGDDQCYVRVDPDGYHEGRLWERFCRSVVHQQRFFNSEAKTLVAEIFDGIHLQQDSRQRPVVYRIEPGTDFRIFRARRADQDSLRQKIRQNPAVELGPPPERLRRAGRMNPAGVAAFYGAVEVETCIAELRPPVGSTIVAGAFSAVRPIYVLDTTRFRGPGKHQNIFFKDFLRRATQWAFMRTFANEISRPVLPDDEHLDYVPTQAVAEYLVHHHRFKLKGEDARIDAIIFRSAQNPAGKNIVLLGDAASVRRPAPKPDRKAVGEALEERIMDWLDFQVPTAKSEPALEADATSIKEFEIKASSYEFDERPALGTADQPDF